MLYELFTGKILFPGRTNNEMLKLMIDLKGPFTKKMLRRCAFAEKHFDMHEPSAPFIYVEEDTISKKLVSGCVQGAGLGGVRTPRACVGQPCACIWG